MAIVPKTKCSRCDRSYAGLKNKCPYCGTHRSRGGKRVSDAGDARARLVIRGLLLLILLITVISATALNLGDDPAAPPAAAGPNLTQNQEENGGEEENGAEQVTPTPTPTPEPTPPPITVTHVDFDWRHKVAGAANDVSLRVNDELEVWAEVFPVDAEVEISWATDNPTICNFTVDPDDFGRITLLARSPGRAIITLTAGEVSNELIVRVN